MKMRSLLRLAVGSATLAGAAFAFSSAMAVVVIEPAPAGKAVYDTSPGLASNQNWGGTLGLDFTVNSPVKVLSLGTFDSSGGTIDTNIEVGIYSLSTGLLVTPIVSFLGTTDPSGAAYVFQGLDVPVTLAKGDYQLAAWGYDQGLGNYNYGYIESGNGGPITFNSLGGALTADGTAYSYSPVVLATIADDGTTRYGAGSFLGEAVPEPATWAMMLLGVGMIGAGLRLARRKNDVALSAA